MLDKIAKKHECTIANVATRFVLDKSQVAGVIIGARLGISQHRENNLRAFDVNLDSSDISEIGKITAKSNDLFEIIGDCGDEYRRPLASRSAWCGASYPRFSRARNANGNGAAIVSRLRSR